MIVTDKQGIIGMLKDDRTHHAACDDYNECGCGNGGEHCMYCIQPPSAHARPAQLTTQVPADIPLDEAIAAMHRIAERDRASLIAAGVLKVDNEVTIHDR